MKTNQTKINHIQGCPCSNCKIIIKSPCPISDLLLPSPPFDWTDPICSSNATVIIKYKEFCQITNYPNSDSFCVLHCNLCKINVCVFIPTAVQTHETHVVINPLMRLSDEIRSKMIYSETYQLYIKEDERAEENYNWSSNDITDRMLFQKKQEVIDALFEEKERKVREYVIQQEDLFEAKREEVKKHYSLLKQQCKEHHIINTPKRQHIESNTDNLSDSDEIDDDINALNDINDIDDLTHLHENCNCNNKNHIVNVTHLKNNSIENNNNLNNLNNLNNMNDEMKEEKTNEMNINDLEEIQMRRDSFDQEDLFNSPKISGNDLNENNESDDEDIEDIDDDEPLLTKPIQTMKSVPIVQTEQSPNFPSTFKELALSKKDGSFRGYDDSEN